MRLKFAALPLAAALLLAGAVAADAATANGRAGTDCVTGCLEGGIVVSPHGGNAGSYSYSYYSQPVQPPRKVTISWTITNTTDHVREVAVLAGATGCAKKVVPYVSPSEVVLDAGESATVYTYAGPQCVGAGTVYASAGQDQGWQSISFY